MPFSPFSEYARIISGVWKCSPGFNSQQNSEMVNKDSSLFRGHPDWVLADSRRNYCHSRNQYVLDFSKPEVVDHIHGPRPAACAGLKQNIREFLYQPLIQAIDSQNILMAYLPLPTPVHPIGKYFRKRTVHIPLHIGNIRFSQDFPKQQPF